MFSKEVIIYEAKYKKVILNVISKNGLNLQYLPDEWKSYEFNIYWLFLNMNREFAYINKNLYSFKVEINDLRKINFWKL